ncbi:amidohydrolase family protein [Pseudarthrobacter raffinosi]|uniref:amidohydrolase family protein n=1 Tax=Pseudarthrobacter raffinosi TaxID=2953651 RepID=UPI00208E1000|nr:amidohydrolase family protein [Pseudarthrobacter sp. MDT3-9]MCO4251223.1 amidohydrolase family protein [Pseudarthrobacter sp. MDT3-9]
MKLITLEEHYLDISIARASAGIASHQSPNFNATFDPKLGFSWSPSADVLQDLDEGRIANMDAHGISMQVLSGLSTQQLPAEHAAELVTNLNNTLAAAVTRHPDRFAAFASLPTVLPEHAADELERGVRDLSMVGTMIMGRTEDQFLSDTRFDPILARAASLNVPIYLHPGVPPAASSAINYAGLDPLVTARFQTAGWGWHMETGIHFLHLVLSGVFDKYPTLQIILGHWGEMVPFFLDRLDEGFPTRLTGLDRSVAEYVKSNVYITPSGMFSHAQLQYCVDTLGTDRIMYSVDYPFVDNDQAAKFLDEAKLEPAVKEAIAHGTAESLLNLA